MTKKNGVSIEDVIGLGNVYRLDEDLAGPATRAGKHHKAWRWEDVSSIHWSQLHALSRWDKPTQDDVIVPKYLEGSDYSGGSVTKSNHKVFIEQFGEVPGVIDLHGSHGSYGVAIRIGTLMDGSESSEEMIEILTKLEDYPVIDEEAMSELETEEEDEAWENWARTDFTRKLSKAFPEMEDAIDELSSDALYKLFHEASDRANVYWEHTVEGPTIRFDRIVDKITADDIDDAEEGDEGNDEEDDDAEGPVGRKNGKTWRVVPSTRRGSDNLYVEGLRYEDDDTPVVAIYRHPGGDVDVPTNAKMMQGALYDLYQIHDELKDGDRFDTPFGRFVAQGVHVVPER